MTKEVYNIMTLASADATCDLGAPVQIILTIDKRSHRFRKLPLFAGAIGHALLHVTSCRIQLLAPCQPVPNLCRQLLAAEGLHAAPDGAAAACGCCGVVQILIFLARGGSSISIRMLDRLPPTPHQRIEALNPLRQSVMQSALHLQMKQNMVTS